MLYRNRFYSNTLGRFLTRDPIGYRGRDENQYRYATNNPIIFLDRNGLIRFKEDGVIIEIHKTDADEQIGQHGHFEQGKGSIKDGYKIRVEDGAIFDSHNQPIFNGIDQLKLKKKTYEKFLDWLKKQQKAGKLGCIVTVTISIPEVAQAAETDGLTGVAEQITNIGLEAAKDTAIAGAAGTAIVSTTIASGGTLTTVTGGTVIATGTTTVSGGTIVAGGTVAGIGTVATVGGLAIAAGGAGYAVGSAIATTKPGRVVTEGLGNAIFGVCSWCFQW